jgi:hypothetical protein
MKGTRKRERRSSLGSRFGAGAVQRHCALSGLGDRPGERGAPVVEHGLAV